MNCVFHQHTAFIRSFACLLMEYFVRHTMRWEVAQLRLNIFFIHFPLLHLQMKKQYLKHQFKFYENKNYIMPFHRTKLIFILQIILLYWNVICLYYSWITLPMKNKAKDKSNNNFLAVCHVFFHKSLQVSIIICCETIADKGRKYFVASINGFLEFLLTNKQTTTLCVKRTKIIECYCQ
jgi:hypothetical protein